MKPSLVSVIIATFNSSRLLPQVLTSVRNQTYPQDAIEILVVDGGSGDATVEIAKKFGCRVIRNPKVEPLYARYLGYVQARGDYIMYIDHDEILLNAHSIKERIDMFHENPRVKATTGNGYRSPEDYGVINRYINEFGDAFSFFMYRLSKREDFFLPIMRSRYNVISEKTSYVVFNLSSSADIPLIELAAGGGMIDAAYFKKAFPEIISRYHLIPHFLHLLRRKHSLLAVMKNDPILHYAADDFVAYVQKIIWRVKNNIFYTKTIGASGFAGREEYEPFMSQLKKFLFLPYAFSLILPGADALSLVMTRRNIAYLIHIPLSVMTAGFILYFWVLKAVGIKPPLTSYDGSTRAYEKK